MGVLATLAAALFPDYVGGSNVPYSPKLADLRSFAAAIDSAIPNAQDLSSVQTSVDNLQQALATVNTALEQLQTFAASVNNTLANDDTALRQLQKAAAFLTAEDVKRASDIETLQNSLTSLSGTVASIGTILVARPGDAPQLYVSSIVGGDPAGLDAASGAVITLDTGFALQVAGPAYVAPRALVSISPNRTYRARWVARRTTDTADPAGATVQFGVAWYDRNRAVLSVATPFALPLSAARGRVEALTVFALAGSAFTDLVAPPSACFARIFVKTFGADQVSAVEDLSIVDISDDGLIAPDVDSLAARLAAVEAKLGITGASA